MQMSVRVDRTHVARTAILTRCVARTHVYSRTLQRHDESHFLQRTVTQPFAFWPKSLQHDSFAAPFAII